MARVLELPSGNLNPQVLPGQVGPMIIMSSRSTHTGIPSFDDNCAALHGVVGRYCAAAAALEGHPPLRKLPLLWSSTGTHWHELARVLNVVVLTDVDQSSYSGSAVQYADWRRRRLRVWQLLALHRKHVPVVSEASSEAGPWPWGDLEVLFGMYSLRLPGELQAVVLAIGWPSVFAAHYNPMCIHALAHGLWRDRSSSSYPITDSDRKLGQRRVLSDGGLLNLNETDDTLTFVDLRDPVEALLFAGAINHSDTDSLGDMEVTGQQTLLDFLLESFAWMSTFAESVAAGSAESPMNVPHDTAISAPVAAPSLFDGCGVRGGDVGGGPSGAPTSS